MGREIRRVPPNWDHPTVADGFHEDQLQPMFDQCYEDARKEWLDGLSNHKPEEHDCLDFWEYEGGPPDRAHYRPWRDEDATWFQVWETVSEGTPVTPPFAAKDELAKYLADYGDWWDQHRYQNNPVEFRALYGRTTPAWGEAEARAFVEGGWAPTMVIVNGRRVGPSGQPCDENHGEIVLQEAR